MIGRAQDLERLEWSGVLAQAACHARTASGREQVAAKLPLGALPELSRAHERTEEMRRAHKSFGRLPIAPLDDPRPALAELQVTGKVLAGARVYELLSLITVARDTGQALRRLDPESFPQLGAEWARFPDLAAVIASIEGRITVEGELEDHASAELARLRAERRQLSQRLHGVLEGLFKEEWTEHVLRDRYVTLRNDRFVVPVRSDTPRRFPGIVHGTSSTDKTLFVEPLETVEINNRLVTLKDEEAEEERRILAAWTRMLSGERARIAEAAAVLAEVDALEAVAAWGDEVDACRPEILEEGGIELRQARHPLLERVLAEQQGPGALVPLDVDLPREHRVLLISGPNAGGKTVALKTVGIAMLLAHSGLPVPAESARFPLFAGLLVDLGDEQSLSGGISTFSSHIRNLAQMVESAGPGALMLIDEIGTGTDPAEGAALGMAILDRLLGRGAHVVATTHHLALKSWAYRTAGAVNAAAEFDEETLRPTYRLVPGVAGSSIGVTMAEQLGLARDVVDDARRRLDPAGAEAASALESVRALASDLQRQRDELVASRRETEARLSERESRIDERERDLERRWSDRLARLTAEFRRAARKAISSLERARDRRLLEREQARQERELRERFAPPAPPDKPSAPPAGWKPSEGERVRVASLAREGPVERLDGDRARVRLGQASFTVPVSDLLPAKAQEQSGSGVRRGPELPRGVSLEARGRDVGPSLNLVGERVHEAISRLDKYLDDATLAGLSEVTIVHGTGTGRLRNAIRELLADHHEVAAFRPGNEQEGGDAVTVASLADDD